jgi:hypothetical protein
LNGCKVWDFKLEQIQVSINGTRIFFLPCKVGKIVYDLTLKLRLPDKAYKL